MDKDIEREMLSYYNERAREHDEVYAGRGPAIGQYSDLYIKDVGEISKMVSEFGSGHLIDIACGTGFWAPHYARNCSQITFVDQSERVLIECSNRVDRLTLAKAPHYVQGNFFDIELGDSVFDCAMIGFLLSHFTSELEEVFFRKLEAILRPHAKIMIIDSLWNQRRKKYRHKEGVEERVLNDGRRFRVYKRYLEQSEIEEILEKNSYQLETLYAGELLFAAIAEHAD
jgi:demethylmenaquinone methyltransferase/2-methoxy-6-polyprenyl-1,4-benzoquinol methylase